MECPFTIRRRCKANEIQNQTGMKLSAMYENIPQKLKDEALFCVWKRVISKNKVQKKPFQINGIGTFHSNPKHFTDFKTACKTAANGYDGIGIGVFNGISAVDIDNCVVDGVLTPKAQKVVEMMDSYSEISPSGNGIRIVFTALDFQFDKSLYYIHNSKEQMEIYVCGATNKFLTITGNSINDKGVEERGHQLKDVLEEFMVRPAAKKTTNNILALGSFLSDEEVIRKAAKSNQGEKFTTLWNGDISAYHNDHSRADNALLCILAFWCGGDREQMKRLFEQSKLYREEKWEQLHGAKSYADMSIDTALSQTDKFYQPDYYKVKKHRFSDWFHKGTFYNAHNFCTQRYHCRKTNVCFKIILCDVKCASCPTCNQTCKDFIKERCSRLDKAPYVCNRCDKAVHKCTIV